MVRQWGFAFGVLLVACGAEGGLQPRPDPEATGGSSSGSGTGRDAPKAQGAVAFKTSVAPGKVCSHTNGQISEPLNIAGVLEALNCDLSRGCKPDEFVVVDGDRGTSVACSVTPSGGNFTVATLLTVDGSSTGDPSVSFQLSGLLTPAGGTATIAQRNSVAGGGGTDNACTVHILAPFGLVKPGGVWGSFECDDFRDQSDISETGCMLSGNFLFENCAD